MTGDFFFKAALLPTGWARNVSLSVAAGRISAVNADSAPRPGAEQHGIVLPGLSNLHSHGFQRALSGRVERRGQDADSFWSWRELMYHGLDRMTPEDVQAITRHAFMEMLEGGFTAVAEFHYLHRTPHGTAYDDPAEMAVRVVEAARESGIGLTLLPVFYAHGDFGGVAPSDGQRRFLSTVDGYARLLEGARAAVASLPGSRLGIAPHSLRAVTPAEIAEILPLAGRGPIHIHIAEQVREVEGCLAWSGARPVEWLLDNVALNDRWCLIHATHLTAAEVAGLARRGVTIGLCPVTEANLGDGIFPGPLWLAERGRWGIGSDSNVLIAANAELRQFEYAQRLATRARNVMAPAGASTGRTLFDAALAGGAYALGDDPRQIGLRTGAPADFFTLMQDEGLEADDALDGWIFGTPTRGVDRVWTNGRCHVDGGKHRDRAEIARAFRETVGRLFGDAPARNFNVDHASLDASHA